MSAAPILALDVDGVIIDGFPRRRWDETLEADLGINTDRMQVEFFDRHWQAIMRGEKPVEEPLADFLKSCGVNVSTLEFLAYWHGNDANVRHEVVEAALSWKNRHGGTLALATNQDLTRARYLRDDLGLGKHFEIMVVSCEIGAQKPEADYFQKADEVLGRIAGQRVIFLDDLEANVESARAHGWEAHHVTRLGHAVEILDEL